MILIYKFFNLPIYQRSRNKYYQCAENDKAKMIKDLESSWEKPYDQILKNTRVNMEDRHWYPRWEFNDIIGFIDVGMDSTDRLTGNIFLMRKYFPKESWERRYRQYDSTAKNQEILYFRELGPCKIDYNDNSTFINGINEILNEAEETIKRLSKTKKYKWVLKKFPFSLECFDFVKLVSEVNPSFSKCV